MPFHEATNMKTRVVLEMRGSLQHESGCERLGRGHNRYIYVCRCISIQGSIVSLAIECYLGFMVAQADELVESDARLRNVSWRTDERVIISRGRCS